MKNRDQLLEERDNRILKHIVNGRTSKDIALLEGIEADNANNMRNQIARKHGIEITVTKGSVVPIGLTNESRLFRSRLGNKLWHLEHNLQMHKLEIATATGIPQRLQTKAKSNTYDWRLSDIERLAKAHNQPFGEFVRELLK